MAAAIALKLAAACEELGLIAEAAAWIELAAPDSWPSTQQQQAAAQQTAVQQLASHVLTAAAAATAGAAQDNASSQVPQHAGFLLAAVQQADPSAVQSWASSSGGGSSSSSGSCTAAAAKSSSQGAWRPGSASRMQLHGLPAAAAGGSAAVGEEVTFGGKAKWLRPSSQQESLLGIAKYLVDHAQYTPAVRLCATALQLAR
jgi:hypothetical protein